MSKDRFFLLAFFTVVILMGVMFYSNIEKLSVPVYNRQTGESMIFKTVNPEWISSLIVQDKLSDKEASFYIQTQE